MTDVVQPDSTEDELTQTRKNEEAQGKIRYIFVNNINPLTVLHVFHFYDQNVLVKQDIERVAAVTGHNGNIQGASELLSILPRYHGWIPCLLKVLRHPNVKQQHVAVMIEAVLGITYTPPEQPERAAGYSELDEATEDDRDGVDFLEHFQQMHLKLGEQEQKIKELQRATMQQLKQMERKIFKPGSDGLYLQMKTIQVEGDDSACVQTMNNHVQEVQKADGDKLYYHGTTERYAKTIWQTGINLWKGKCCRDFSNGKGFYVTENLAQALDWAQRVATSDTGNKAAVLVFKIPRAMQMENHINLYGEDKKKDWQNIVEHFYGGENNESLKEALAEIKFIEGPVSGTCESFRHERQSENTQLCILDENFASRFGQLQNMPFCFIV